MLAIAVTVVVILFGPRKFHSEALLLLRVGHENVRLDPTVTTGETVQVEQNRESEVNTALATLRSRNFATEVMNSIGSGTIQAGYLPGGKSESSRGGKLNPVKWLKKIVRNLDPIDDAEDAVEVLMSNVEIAAPRDSNIVSVEYTTKSPELAQRVVEAWVESFLQRHPQLHRTQGSHDFFVEQSELLGKQLAEARNELKRIKNEAELLTVSDQQAILSQQITEARNRRFRLKSNLAAAKAKVERLRIHIDSVDDQIVVQERVGVANEARDGMRQQLYDLELQILNSRQSAEHPTMIALKHQLEQARKIVAEQEETRTEIIGGVNPLEQKLQELLYIEDANYESINSESIAVSREIDELLAELHQLNNNEQLVADIEQRIGILDERYRSVWGKMEQARIDDALELKSITSVNIVQDATLEHRPVSPNKKLCAVLGMAAAMAGFVGPILLRKRRDSIPQVEVYSPDSGRPVAASFAAE